MKHLELLNILTDSHMASVLKGQQKHNESKQFMTIINPFIIRKPLIRVYWISLKHLINFLIK